MVSVLTVIHKRVTHHDIAAHRHSVSQLLGGYKVRYCAVYDLVTVFGYVVVGEQILAG